MSIIQTVCLIAVPLMSLVAMVIMAVNARAMERQTEEAIRIAREAVDFIERTRKGGE